MKRTSVAGDRAKRHVLVVGDDPRRLTVPLQRRGFRIEVARKGRGCIALCAEHRFDLVLIDMDADGRDDMSFVAEIAGVDPALPVIVLAEEASLDTAVTAIRAGATDYLIREQGETHIMSAIDRALMIGHPDIGITGMGDLVGRSESMRAVYQQIESLASTDASALLSGESGSGKKLAAREIVQRSNRRAGPFVVISCASLSPSILGSELFGHEVGAFAGAVHCRPGLFEAADGGTLLLDEIGLASPLVQAGLLQALEEQRVRRLGSNQSRKVDVRVLATTRADVQAEIGRNTFRPDLYYRLGTNRLHMPALRERREDIPLLAIHLMTRIGARLSRTRHLTRGAIGVLTSHSWPGNVRELENVLENAFVLTGESMIGRTAIARFMPASRSDHPPEPLDDVERRHVESALMWARGNICKAATVLGIPRTTMYRMLKRMDLSVER